MRLVAIITSAILVLIILAVTAGPVLIDWNRYKGLIGERIREHTGYEAVLTGDLNLSLIPSPKAYINDVAIKAPEGSAFENLATFRRLDFNIALAPLLSGEVRVNSVNLIAPKLSLERYKNGRGNWQTPQIDALLDGGKAEQEGDKSKASHSQGGGMISIDRLSVQDGAFTFTDRATGKETALGDIDVELKAETLSGPFEGQAGFMLDRNKVAVNFRTARAVPGSESVAVNVTARLNEDQASLKYSGVATLGGPVEVQGETELTVSDLKALLAAQGIKADYIKPAKLNARGLLSAGPDSASINDFSMTLADTDITGKVSLSSFSPLAAELDLAAKNAFNMDAFFNVPGKEKKILEKGKDPQQQAAAGGVLEAFGPLLKAGGLPDATISAAFKAPALIYRGEEYRNFVLNLKNAGKALQFDAQAAAIPGQGSLALAGTLKPADQALSFSVKGKTENLPFTLQSIAPGMDLAQAERFRSAAVDMSADVKSDSITLRANDVRLDSQNFGFTAIYKEPGQGRRPQVGVTATIAALNLTPFIKGKASQDVAAKPAEPSSVRQKAAELSLPYDLVFDLNAAEVRVQNHILSGVLAKGALEGNAVRLEAFSIKNIAGASLQASGTVGDIRDLKAIDITLAGQSDHVRKTAQALAFNLPNLPDKLEAAKLSLNAKGDYSALNVLANVEALNGKLIVKGAVKDPLGTLAAENLSLQIRHSSTPEALALLGMDGDLFAPMAGPFDFYTDVKIQDKIYTLENIAAKLGNASVQGSGAYHALEPKPYFQGNLKFSDLVLGDSGAKPSGSGVAAGREGPDVLWSREAFETGWMHAVDFDVALSGNSLKYGEWNLQTPVLEAQLKDGFLKLSKLSAGLFGGTASLAGTVKSAGSQRQPLTVQGTAQVRDVSLEPLVLSLAGGQILKGAGKISLDTTLETVGISPAALIYDLRGSGEVTGREIVLDGFDLTRFAKALSSETKPGDTALGLWKGTIKGGQTRFDTLSGAYMVQEGVANIQSLDLDGPQVALQTTGKVDLPKWFIDTAHKVHLKEHPDIPDFTIKVSGPLNNPSETFGQGVLNDYLQRKLERKVQDLVGEKLDGKLNKLLNGVLPQQPAPIQPQQQAPANDNAAPPATPEQPAVPAELQDQKPVRPEDAFQDLMRGLLQR